MRITVTTVYEVSCMKYEHNDCLCSAQSYQVLGQVAAQTYEKWTWKNCYNFLAYKLFGLQRVFIKACIHWCNWTYFFWQFYLLYSVKLFKIATELFAWGHPRYIWMNVWPLFCPCKCVLNVPIYYKVSDNLRSYLWNKDWIHIYCIWQIIKLK